MPNAAKFKKHQFAALDAAGTTPDVVVSFGGKYPLRHTVEAEITGSPTAATAKLEGSLNGVVWADLTGVQDLLALVTNVGAAVFHIDGKPVQKIRVELVALSGGSSPTVTFQYLGV